MTFVKNLSYSRETARHSSLFEKFLDLMLIDTSLCNGRNCRPSVKQCHSDYQWS